MKIREHSYLILITNDDGYFTDGLRALIDSAKRFGEVVVVAPDSPRSAQSASITIDHPLRYSKISEDSGTKIYKTNGTTVDCVKLGLNEILDRAPDLILSGINHGSNSSVSVVYSGTMGGVIEGALHSIPSIGFSLCSNSKELDFSYMSSLVEETIELVLKNGLPEGVCLNVNAPVGEIKGTVACRQTDGRWEENFIEGKDARGGSYFWLSGSFVDKEKGNLEGDVANIDAGYATVVPIKVDYTDYQFLNELKKWYL